MKSLIYIQIYLTFIYIYAKKRCIFLAMFILLFSSCEAYEKSKNYSRFENITKIKLPQDFTIKNNIFSIGIDGHATSFEIDLTKKDMQKVINDLLHSPFLRDSIYYNTTYKHLEWDKPPIWIETKKGNFQFYAIEYNHYISTENGRRYYDSREFETTIDIYKNTITFKENYWVR